jgi:hypothetical protein
MTEHARTGIEEAVFNRKINLRWIHLQKVNGKGNKKSLPPHQILSKWLS